LRRVRQDRAWLSGGLDDWAVTHVTFSLSGLNQFAFRSDPHLYANVLSTSGTCKSNRRHLQTRLFSRRGGWLEAISQHEKPPHAPGSTPVSLDLQTTLRVRSAESVQHERACKNAPSGAVIYWIRVKPGAPPCGCLEVVRRLSRF